MATNNLDFRVKNGLVVEQGATISGLTYPTEDGLAGEALLTDGDGNLYFGDSFSQSDFDAAIQLKSIDVLSDVDTTTNTPTSGQALIWNGTHFVPGDVVTGDSTFLALTDTPSSYTDQVNRVVKVNSTGDGLDFGDVVSGSQSRESFTSTSGQTEFELEYTYGGQNSILVYVNGVPQFPGENFTLSGNILTFTDAPDTGSQVLVYGLTPITSEVTPGDGTVTAKKLAASAYTRDIFVGDGVESTFELSGDVGSPLAPFVYVGGVLQDPVTHYNIDVLATPQTLTFTEAIPDEAEVTVVYGPVNVTGVPSDQSITFAKLANSNFEYQTFFGDGAETDFTLTQRALLPQHLIVTVAGIPQTPDGTTYTVDDTTLSFAEAPALNAKIVVRFYGTPVPIGDILDNSVTTPKILNGAVTPEKLDREYVEPLDLALVATTGSYTHLSDKPTIPDISQFDVVTFNKSAGLSAGQGQLTWNSADGTLDLGLGYSDVVLQLGQEMHYTIRNASGSTIQNGTSVYCSGVTAGSGRMEASPFVADGSISMVQYLGIATHNISNGVNGVVTQFGYVRGLDTRGTAASGISVGDEDWAVGDKLYAHPTVAGKLTNVEPQLPSQKICAAVVITRHQSTGVIFVRPTQIIPTSANHLTQADDAAVAMAIALG